MQLFSSLGELFQKLSDTDMTQISAEMRLEHLRRTHGTAEYWSQALLRALEKGLVPTKIIENH